jgi:hypothetical protein
MLPKDDKAEKEILSLLRELGYSAEVEYTWEKGFVSDNEYSMFAHDTRPILVSKKRKILKPKPIGYILVPRSSREELKGKLFVWGYSKYKDEWRFLIKFLRNTPFIKKNYKIKKRFK